MPRSFWVETLGCPKNQVDSDKLTGLLHADGLRAADNATSADLIVVNGNPLEDLKVLYPTGTEAIRNGRAVPAGGVEWTIKNGIPYHGPTLLREVKDIVTKARTAARP